MGQAGHAFRGTHWPRGIIKTSSAYQVVKEHYPQCRGIKICLRYPDTYQVNINKRLLAFLVLRSGSV